MLIHRNSWIPIATLTASLFLTRLAYAADDLLPYEAIATGSWPEAVAIGDINGDGRNDVVMTTSSYFDEANDFKLFVFTQDASGALSAPVRYATGYTYSPQTVAIGDLNGDGLNDVAVGNAGSNIEIFYQEPSGTLAPGVSMQTPYSMKIRVGDLNADGLADIAGIGWGGSEVGVFLQDAGGTLALSATYTAPHGGYDDLELGDVNDDARTDIVVMSGQGYAYDNLAVLTQNASGAFDPAAYYDLGGNELTRGVGVGDVTGDGRSDVVVSYGSNRPDSSIAIFGQLPDGTLDAPVSISSDEFPESLDVADINGDALPDLVVLHGGLNALGIYLQDANGSLGPETLYPIPYATSYNPHGLALGDINSDGAPDVVIADYNHGLVTLKNAHPPVNLAPIADAGADQKVKQRRIVRLDGTGSSDPDGEISAYEWSQLSGPAVTLHATSTPGVVLFRAPRYFRFSHELVFELKVTDNAGATATDQVTIVVNK